MVDRDRPTDARTDSSEGFLRRWSRRKVEARSAPAAAATDRAIPVAETAPASLQEEAPERAPSPVELEDLPDIESLDASSDFSVFMRPDVPADLRTLALRKLWRSDPAFSKLDGLVEYGEDFTIASWPKGAIKTAYQIGRGFVNEARTLEPTEVESRPPEPSLVEPPPDTEQTVASAEPTDPNPPPQTVPEPAVSDEAQPAPASGRTDARGSTKRRRLPRRG